MGTTVDKKMQVAAPKTKSSVFTGLEFINALNVNKYGLTATIPHFVKKEP